MSLSILYQVDIEFLPHKKHHWRLNKKRLEHYSKISVDIFALSNSTFLPSGIIVVGLVWPPAPCCKMSYVKWMERPTWHKVRFWRFCSQSVWTWNIFSTFLPSNKESWTKKCGENDWAKLLSDIFCQNLRRTLEVGWRDIEQNYLYWELSIIINF